MPAVHTCTCVSVYSSSGVCTIKSEYSTNDLCVWILIDAAPLTPSACRGYATSPTTIVVRWSYPISTAGLTGYLISYDSVESSGISVDGEVRVSRSLSLYSIRLLEEDVQYQISIKSYFGRLYSRACTITVKTFTARPSGPPQNVRIPSKSSNSLSVSWSPPDLRHRNGPIVRYSVYVYPQSGGRPLYSYSAYRTSYEVSRLSPYTVYRVKVAAVTRNGTGPFSPLISERTTADGTYVLSVYVHMFFCVHTYVVQLS